MVASALSGVLTPEDYRELVEGSAILPQVLTEEDICSQESSLGLPAPDPTLRHPNSHKGQYFGIWGETDDNWRSIDLGPGIWFGTRDVAGRLSGQYKPKHPRTAPSGHVVKYEGCRGTRPSFAVPSRSLDALVSSLCEVFFTEGYKKALALASAGACAISLAGVESWSVKPEPNAPSEPIDDFDEVKWRGRIVFIVYDSDAAFKDGVQWAEKRLTRELERRGAVVVVLRVPQAQDGSKRGIDDYIRDRLADGVSRADALSELKGVALAELIGRATAKQRAARTGSDGGATCDGSCPTSVALAEQTRTYRGELELLRNGPVPTAEALAIDHLVTVAHDARSRGEELVPLYGPADAKRAGVGANTMSRAIGQVKRWQANEATASALSFRIEDKWKGGKLHLHLRVLPASDQDGVGRTKAAEYRAIARLPRDADRAQHGGSRVACPKHPDAPVQRTTIWRCTEDECTWVHQETATLGRTPHQDGAGEVGDVAEIHGSPFMTTVQGLDADHQHQDGVDTYLESYQHQDGAGSDRPLSSRPITFVTRDDLAWAAGPPYLGESPPPEPEPWQPPQVAPREHLAWSPHRSLPSVAGGEE